MIRWMTTTAMLLAISAAGLAQDGGTGEEFDLAEAMRNIHRLMGKAEEELLETASRQKAAETSEEVVKEIEKLLKGHEQTGKDIVDKINELLDNLPRSSGGGGGSGEEKPDQEQEPKGKGGEEKEVGDRNPENSRKGEPKGHDNKDQEPQQEKADRPPPDEAKEKTEVDLSKEWLDNLPPQLRMDVLNGNFERVPEKYRALIEAWTKKMAAIDDDR